MLDQVVETDSQPSPIKFERILVEDVAKSAQEGRYVAKEVHMVHESAQGSRDIFKSVVSKWLVNKTADVKNGRIPQKWLDAYHEAYSRWKVGHEVPLHGTPIRGWGVISPVQQEELIRINVMTVEGLAAINDEGMRRIGLGALDLKNKAIAALRAAKDTGTLVMENSELKKRLAVAEANQAEMQQQLAMLMAQSKAQSYQPGAVVQVADDSGISAADILDPVVPEPAQVAEALSAAQPVKRRPGRPRKVDAVAAAIVAPPQAQAQNATGDI
jgi:hypothetical protein